MEQVQYWMEKAGWAETEEEMEEYNQGVYYTNYVPQDGDGSSGSYSSGGSGGQSSSGKSSLSTLSNNSGKNGVVLKIIAVIWHFVKKGNHPIHC